jgi:hypothetical protein
MTAHRPWEYDEAGPYIRSISSIKKIPTNLPVWGLEVSSPSEYRRYDKENGCRWSRIGHLIQEINGHVLDETGRTESAWRG